MTVTAVPRRAPAIKPLALALALSLTSFAAGARAEDQSLPSITVTGARFAADPALTPIGATVITADDMRRAGAADVNQAIRKIGGVYGRQSLDASPDFGLDLRGFGSNSSQNLVIMLDGVRLSESELGNGVLSTIALETVERIEIIRGGASVLFGEGATGGVIQVVTKRPLANSRRGTLRAEAGQFGFADLRASVAQAWNGFALDAAIGKQKTDNYRVHNGFEQTTLSAGAQWTSAAGRAGVRIDSTRQDAQFAGSLTLAQFQRDPRQATTPKDFGKVDSDRINAFAEHRIGALDLAAELSHREKTVDATYFYDFGSGEFASPIGYDSKQTQFSPRLRHLSQLGGQLNELVAGVDLIRWSRVTRSDFSKADATQESRAFYIRNELKWDAAHNARLAIGARHETFDKDTVDPLASPYASKQSQNAWEVQGSVNVAAATSVYAKAGRSFRVPNVDENAFRSSTGVLDIQTSKDLEAGVTFGGAALGLTARAFRHELENEIFYDPTLNGFGANTNLDPTLRKGVELDGHVAISPELRLAATAQFLRARFTAGPNAGREMVLVPHNLITSRLSWTPGKGHSADIGMQWVSSQLYGSDFANTFRARMPSYVTFDARYARTIGPWEFGISGANLADKQHFSNAFGCRSGIYPSDGRQVKLSARYDF
jgi:iron complex outermembrane receptor protein